MSSAENTKLGAAGAESTSESEPRELELREQDRVSMNELS
jgi:hypothetical protein